MRYWRRLLCCLALAPIAASAESDGTAASGPLDLSDLGAPAFTVYTARDGVPDEAIVAAEVDAQGFAWLGSASTVARFDGQAWQAMPPPGARGLVRDLHLDQAGTLWVSFDTEGIARYDGHGWQRETRASGLATDHTLKFAELPDEHGRRSLWLMTWDAGLLHRVGDRWLPDPGNAELPPQSIWGLVETKRLFGHARQWVGLFSGGLWYREPGGSWQHFADSRLDYTQITDLLVTEDHGEEELWVVTYGDGLRRFSTGGARSWNEQQGDLASNQLYSARATQVADGDRVLWLASRAGLMRLHRDKVDVYDRRYGLPSDAVRAVQVRRSPDGADILWIPTEGGIARTVVSNNPWRTVSLMGARANGVFSVLAESDGRGGERLWIASTHDGLGLLEAGRWRYFTAADGALPSSNIRTVTRVTDERGVPTLFVGVDGGQLLRAGDGFRFELIDTPWPKHEGQSVLHVLARERGATRELWFATRQSGIHRLSGGNWTSFRASGAVDPWAAIQLAEQHDAEGRSWLWASTNQGLARLGSDDWTLLGSAEGLPDTDLKGLTLMSGDGGRPELWIGSSRGGLIRLDVSDPRQPRVLSPNDLPPPPDRTVYSALRDSKGRTYLCTNNGVQQLTPHAGKGYDARVFRRRDGLVHEECNTNGQFIDSHDRYWIGTLGGVSVYDPAALPPVQRPHPAALLLTDVRVDGTSVGDGGRVRVPPGAREFRVDYALLTWQREDESRYRTQLLDFDPEPGAWSAQNSRSFGLLPPGRYTLAIEARDYAGVAGTPLNLEIEVLPAWWQRRWVQVLGALAAVFVVFASAQWRLRALRLQRRRLRAEVTARTIELDAANALLTELSYVDALTGVANRRRLMQRLQEAWQAACVRASPLALILVDLDHFKDYNDRHGHVTGDQALRAVAEAMRGAAGGANLIARYGGEEFACVLEDAGLEQALEMAERIRAAVTRVPMPTPDLEGESITLSAGVAACRPDDTGSYDDLIRAADAALYRAKHEGRNRVCSAE